ncbi:SCO family protein [Actibacterium ureilyticum]|uniref:SCO family protein n=1 Tax=Actibacterium ureilyticum TaxID=1590614 RepID=UPI000BAB154A|nr:SCO family protein [Actibacterium ureilyticum]
MRILPVIALLAGVGLSGGLAWGFLKPDRPAPFSSVIPARAEFQFEPPAPGSYRLNHIKPAPDGRVLDTDGHAQTLADLTKGKITLVSFVYLMCGDVNGCPLAMSTLFELHDASAQLPGLNRDVQLMTISFDPERDTVEAIHAFAYPILSDTAARDKFGWHVLTTGGMADLQPILDGYGQVIDRSTDQDQISHLLRLYLVDRSGQIRNVYGLGTIDPRLLMTDIETLLMEERQP